MATEQKVKDYECTLGLYGIEGLMEPYQVRHVEAELVGLRILLAAEKAIAILQNSGQDTSDIRKQHADLARVIARSESERR